MTTYWMIRDKETGLFASGGEYPDWKEKGKVYKQKNHATSHLSAIGKNTRDKFYQNAELVEFEFTPIIKTIISVPEVIRQRDERVAADTARRIAYRQKQDYERAKRIAEQYEAQGR